MARRFKSVVSGPGSVNRFLIPANVEDTTPPLPTTDLRATKNVAQESLLRKRNVGGDGSHETDPSPGDSVPSPKSYDEMNREAASRSLGDPGGRPGFTDKGLGSRVNPTNTAITYGVNTALAIAGTAIPALGWGLMALGAGRWAAEGGNPLELDSLGKKAANQLSPEHDRDANIDRSWSKVKKDSGVSYDPKPKNLESVPTWQGPLGHAESRHAFSAQRPGKPSVEELAGVRHRLDAHAMINLQQEKQKAQSKALDTNLAKEVIAQETAVTAAADKADPGTSAEDTKKGQPLISLPVWHGQGSDSNDGDDHGGQDQALDSSGGLETGQDYRE
jgi:hypothetical protein